MTATRVSVVIPTCGRGHFLRGAIQSVLSQSFEAWEVIVVDDSRAGDGMAPVVDEFHDERIRYCRNERTAGANGARNTGIRKARGEYIAMLDDDDLFLPGKLAKQVNMLDSDKQIGVVSTQAYVIDREGRVVRGIENHLTPGRISYNLVFANCIVHSSVVIRRELFQQAGYYNENLNQAQDYDLWSRWLRRAIFAQINEKLVCWREHDDGVTGRRKSDQKRTALILAENNIQMIAGKTIPKELLRKILAGRESSLGELRHSIRVYQDVYAGFISSADRHPGLSARFSRELSIAMHNRMDASLYTYFMSRSKAHLIAGFFLLPPAAKKILCSKALSRVRKRLSERGRQPVQGN